MKRLAAAALMVVLAGCASAPLQQDQTGSAEMYRLIAVNNVAPPVLIDEGSFAGSEIAGGDLTLKPDNTFRMRIEMRTAMSSTKPFEYQRNFDGNYQSSTIGVHMTWQEGIVTSGVFFGQTLRIYRDGVEYLFVK